jgi:hypothetical protein
LPPTFRPWAVHSELRQRRNNLLLPIMSRWLDQDFPASLETLTLKEGYLGLPRARGARSNLMYDTSSFCLQMAILLGGGGRVSYLLRQTSRRVIRQHDTSTSYVSPSHSGKPIQQVKERYEWWEMQTRRSRRNQKGARYPGYRSRRSRFLCSLCRRDHGSHSSLVTSQVVGYLIESHR